MSIALNLTVPEQRRIAEHVLRGPCFRMWVTAEEAAAIRGDFTCHPLTDGRYAIWRRESDLDNGYLPPSLMKALNTRRLADDVA